VSRRTKLKEGRHRSPKGMQNRIRIQVAKDNAGQDTQKSCREPAQNEGRWLERRVFAFDHRERGKTCRIDKGKPNIR